MANVLLHLGLGLALAVLAIRWAPRYPRECGAFVAAAIPAVYLAVAGNTLQHRWALWLHIALALAAVALIGWRVFGAGRYRAAFAACVSVLLLLPASAALWRTVHPDPDNFIVNPTSPPLSMDEEGAGAHSPFAPSSAQTNTGGIIPSNFFMDSETCGECHKDIYEQWKSSMHHFASFNNQFYRKSIEYMQDVVGTQPEQVVRRAATTTPSSSTAASTGPSRSRSTRRKRRPGLAACRATPSCTSAAAWATPISRVEYPPLHELASSQNQYIRAIDYFLTYLNPEPHRRTFLKPFMREQSAEFCAAATRCTSMCR